MKSHKSGKSKKSLKVNEIRISNKITENQRFKEFTVIIYKSENRKYQKKSLNTDSLGKIIEIYRNYQNENIMQGC